METYQGYASPAGDPLLGRTIGDRYRIESILGRGGMGAVYRAVDTRLHDRACAVKVLAVAYDGRDVERFQREVRLVAGLSSPYTVRVYDVGDLPDSRPFLVMELLEGRSLSDLSKPIQVEELLPVMHGILSSLVEAHAQGIVHRDLKPANILLVGGSAGLGLPKVLDFGIAKELRPSEEQLQTTALVGTPAYMSPEQIQRSAVDGRADLYALGVLLYELLAGESPFAKTDQVPDALTGLPSEYRLGWQHMYQEPEPISEISPELWTILARLLEKSPKDRYPNAEAVIEALEQLPESGFKRSKERPFKRTLLLGALSLIALAWWLFQGISPGESPLEAGVQLREEQSPPDAQVQDLKPKDAQLKDLKIQDRQRSEEPLSPAPVEIISKPKPKPKPPKVKRKIRRPRKERPKVPAQPPKRPDAGRPSKLYFGL